MCADIELTSGCLKRISTAHGLALAYPYEHHTIDVECLFHFFIQYPVRHDCTGPSSMYSNAKFLRYLLRPGGLIFTLNEKIASHFLKRR